MAIVVSSSSMIGSTKIESDPGISSVIFNTKNHTSVSIALMRTTKKNDRLVIMSRGGADLRLGIWARQPRGGAHPLSPMTKSNLNKTYFNVITTYIELLLQYERPNNLFLTSPLQNASTTLKTCSADGASGKNCLEALSCTACHAKLPEEEEASLVDDDNAFLRIFWFFRGSCSRESADDDDASPSLPCPFQSIRKEVENKRWQNG